MLNPSFAQICSVSEVGQVERAESLTRVKKVDPNDWPTLSLVKGEVTKPGQQDREIGTSREPSFTLVQSETANCEKNQRCFRNCHLFMAAAAVSGWEPCLRLQPISSAVVSHSM